MSYPADWHNEFVQRSLSDRQYLELPQAAVGADLAESSLTTWAENGYLLVSLADDVALHGDPLFRQTRTFTQPLPAADFWQANRKLHYQLCELRQLHLPLRLAPGPDEPAALAWLILAPTTGTLHATGFECSWPLDTALRTKWLLAWAQRLGAELSPAQRLLIQLPGPNGPAYWHYHNYQGDTPVPGSPLERVRLLLAGLPRYSGLAAPLPATPSAADTWPLLANDSPSTWGSGEVRRCDHLELPLFSFAS